MTSYLYVIASSVHGPCKLGFSVDPLRRLKQLQTGHSETLQLFHTEEISSDKALLMEQAVHRENRHRKIKGEWFNMTVDFAILEVRHTMIRFEEEIETRARQKLT